MRILCSGDHHWDEHRRFDECVRIHEWQVDVARRERIDLFLSSGDIYEGASTPIERQAVARSWLQPMAEICPVVISKGNHDRERDCWLLGRLKTRHPLIVEEQASVHHVAGAAVAAVAWPDRASIAASVQAAGVSVDDAARDAFRTLLLGLAQQLAEHDGPRIGLGHFMVDGSVVSTGQPLLGMPLNLGLSDLALLGAPLVICGHIHKAQEWRFGDSHILYTGSPFRTDFGQLEEKSVTIAEFDGPRLVSVIRLATPATKMIHLEDEWGVADSVNGGRPCWLVGDGDPDDFPGAEIRFRYHVANDQRAAAKAAAAAMKLDLLNNYGAADVKLEEVVITTSRARAPEIAAATNLSDKLCALWTSRGDDLPEERRARLLGKVATLEVEANDAA